MVNHINRLGGIMNLSLEVAKIMWPDAPWDLTSIYNKHAAFDHTTPEALGQMCLWWSNNYRKWHKESGFVSILSYPTCGDPNRELAEAIIATQEGEG